MFPERFVSCSAIDSCFLSEYDDSGTSYGPTGVPGGEGKQELLYFHAGHKQWTELDGKQGKLKQFLRLQNIETLWPRNLTPVRGRCCVPTHGASAVLCSHQQPLSEVMGVRPKVWSYLLSISICRSRWNLSAPDDVAISLLPTTYMLWRSSPSSAEVPVARFLSFTFMKVKYAI